MLIVVFKLQKLIEKFKKGFFIFNMFRILKLSISVLYQGSVLKEFQVLWKILLNFFILKGYLFLI